MARVGFPSLRHTGDRRLICLVPGIPRIGLDEMPDALRATLEPRVTRLGYLGEFFQLAAHQPEALRLAIAYLDELKAALPPRLVEVVAITVSARTDNAFERVQHERVALRIGFTPDEVAALGGGDGARCTTLSDLERAVSDLAARGVASAGNDTPHDFAGVVELAGAATAVACVLLIGHYTGFCIAANTWELTPPVASPLPATP
jgi:hypothetical protein